MGRRTPRGYDQQLIERGAHLAWRVKERVPFCWMCRSTAGKRAKEHIFPLWLQKQLGAEDELWSPTHRDYLGRVISSRGPYPTTALVAGEVCEKCNTGWMNEIEESFRSVMFPRVGAIDDESAPKLCQWFAKTAIVLNTSQNYRLMIPREVRHAVKHGVPRDMAVFLGRMPNPPDQLAFAQQAGSVIGVLPADEAHLAVAYSERVYACVLRVEDVLAAVVYAPPGSWAKPCAQMTQLHPSSGSRIAWDSLPVIEDMSEPLVLCGDYPAFPA